MKKIRILILSILLLPTIMVNKVYSQDNNIDFKLGMVQLMSGNIDAAIIYFNKAIKKDANHVDAHFNRGQCYLRKGEMQKAITDFTIVINDDNTKYTAYNLRGMSYYAVNEYKKAIDDFTASIALKNDNPIIYFNRSKAYMALNNYKKGLADADKVLISLPNYIGAHEVAAKACTELRKYEVALNHYNFLITQSPSKYHYYIQRGRLLVQMGRNDEACKDFKQSVALGSGEAKFDMQKACK